VYDAAERFAELEEKQDAGAAAEDVLEKEIVAFCDELIVPRRAEIIKRLLLTADFMHQLNCEEQVVQKTLATALSLVGGFLPECRHPFIRRLVLDSVDAARQALSEGYDLRLDEGNIDDYEE
jgi:hypothetical protein